MNSFVQDMNIVVCSRFGGYSELCKNVQHLTEQICNHLNVSMFGLHILLCSVHIYNNIYHCWYAL